MRSEAHKPAPATATEPLDAGLVDPEYVARAPGRAYRVRALGRTYRAIARGRRFVVRAADPRKRMRPLPST